MKEMYLLMRLVVILLVHYKRSFLKYLRED